VGSIVTQYLIDTLKMEKIGNIYSDELPSIVAFHNNTTFEPISIFYNKHYNLIVIHSLTNVQGIEWKYARTVHEIASKIGAKEIISVDGIITNKKNSNIIFKTTSKEKIELLKKSGGSELNEGVLVGVIASMIVLSMHNPKIPHTAIFSEIKSLFPDSKAAAEIIKFIDSYLGLSIDYEGLIKQAEEFENKLKRILESAREKQRTKEEKNLSYFV